MSSRCEAHRQRADEDRLVGQRERGRTSSPAGTRIAPAATNNPGPGDQPTTGQALITRATYSPLAPFFDKIWQPSEIEAVKTNP